MLFLGNNLVYSMGSNNIANVTAKTQYSGSVYVKNSCLIINNNQNTNQSRSGWMQRPFDLLNYSGNQTLGGTPDVGGFEVEATFIPTKESGWGTLWGCRIGTSGKVTRLNILIDSNQQISMGASILPSTNPSYGYSLLGRKVTVRFICVPVEPQEPDYFNHSYLGRIIVKDSSGTTLTDETQIFGDNASLDAMFSTYTSFWSEPLTWFYRASSNNPNNIGYGANGFEGYFFGAKVYLNPTGADTNIPTRILIQNYVPVKTGQLFTGTGAFVGIEPTRVERDGIVVERIDMQNGFDIGNYDSGARFAFEMQNTSQFQWQSQVTYVD